MPRKKNRRKELQAAKRKEAAKAKPRDKAGAIAHVSMGSAGKMASLAILASHIIQNPEK